MMKIAVILFVILAFFVTTLSYSDSSLTPDDLKSIEILQDKGFYPKDMNLDDITHQDVLRAKQTIEQVYGIKFEWLRNPPPPDPRFSSPEKTWELYKQALLMGDLNLVESCLSPHFAENHISVLRVLGNEKMRKIAEAMRPIEKVRQDDKKGEYLIRKTETHGGQAKDITYSIYFVNILGNWKISRY